MPVGRAGHGAGMVVPSLAPRTTSAVPRTTALVPGPRAARLLVAVCTRLAGALALTGLTGLLWWSGSAVSAPVAQAAAPDRVAPGMVTPVSGWQWPLRPRPVVVHGFDPPAQPWLSGHRGVDLLGRAGQPVHAAGAGTVTFAGMVAGRGVVTVNHGDLRTTYEPLHVSVRVGDRVSADDVLGSLALIGGHCLPRACLHWGLLRGQRYLNPLSLVGAGPVRLLPLEGAPEAFAPEHESRLAGPADRARPSPHSADVDAEPGATPPSTRAPRSGPARRSTSHVAAASPGQLRAVTATIGGLGVAGAAAAWALGRRRRC